MLSDQFHRKVAFVSQNNGVEEIPSDSPSHAAYMASGFLPGDEVIHTFGTEFTVGEILKIMNSSTFSQPQAWQIELSDSSIFHVVLTQANVYFPATAASHVARFDSPERSFTGWIMPSPFNPDQPSRQVRIVLTGGDMDTPPAEASFQVVPTTPVDKTASFLVKY